MVIPFRGQISWLRISGILLAIALSSQIAFAQATDARKKMTKSLDALYPGFLITVAGGPITAYQPHRASDAALQERAVNYARTFFIQDVDAGGYITVQFYDRSDKDKCAEVTIFRSTLQELARGNVHHDLDSRLADGPLKLERDQLLKEITTLKNSGADVRQCTAAFWQMERTIRPGASYNDVLYGPVPSDKNFLYDQVPLDKYGRLAFERTRQELWPSTGLGRLPGALRDVGPLVAAARTSFCQLEQQRQLRSLPSARDLVNAARKTPAGDQGSPMRINVPQDAPHTSTAGQIDAPSRSFDTELTARIDGYESRVAEGPMRSMRAKQLKRIEALKAAGKDVTTCMAAFNATEQMVRSGADASQVSESSVEVNIQVAKATFSNKSAATHEPLPANNYK